MALGQGFFGGGRIVFEMARHPIKTLLFLKDVIAGMYYWKKNPPKFRF